MKKSFFATLLLSISITVVAQVKDSNAVMHYHNSKYDCAIFPKGAGFDAMHVSQRFTPLYPDVDKAEHALQEQMLLQKDTSKRLPDIYRHLEKYRRQYFGYTDNTGHKILYINLFWDDSKYIKNWLKQMVMMQGGGSNYFNVKYDITANRVYDLAINSDN